MAADFAKPNLENKIKTDVPEDLKKLPGEYKKVQGRSEVTIKFKDSVETLRDCSYVRVE